MYVKNYIWILYQKNFVWRILYEDFKWRLQYFVHSLLTSVTHFILPDSTSHCIQSINNQSIYHLKMYWLSTGFHPACSNDFSLSNGCIYKLLRKETIHLNQSESLSIWALGGFQNKIPSVLASFWLLQQQLPPGK